MPALHALAVTSRTATVMLSPDAAHYRLDQPVDWRLRCGEKAQQQGRAQIVPLFLEGLKPDTDYEFRSTLGSLTFRTAPCAGLVKATDFGADLASADNAAAFARAIAATPKGGTMMLPPGRYTSGPVFAASNLTIYLPKGAEIAARADRDGWPILPTHGDDGRVVGTWEGLPAASYAAPITAIGCDNLTLTGAGVIDGGGDRGDWWSWPKDTRNGARRPRTLFLAHCTNLTLSGLTVRNSPSWTVHPYRCHRLRAMAMTIENPEESPNTDGFNPESCTDVLVQGLRISVGDDCIAVKAGKRDGAQTDHLAPTQNLIIRNCLMERGHGAVVLGSEMSGDITDVTITHCDFIGTDRGLRIKTRRGRGGTVARISLSNVRMTDVATPLAVNGFYFCDADGKSQQVQSRSPAPVDDTTPKISDITVRDVHATGVQHAAAALLGLPEAPLSGIRIEGFHVSYDTTATPGAPLMASHIADVCHGGILRQFATVEGDAAAMRMQEDF